MKLKNNKFKQRLNNKEFLIMDHRGFWGGNIIQNTREASILSYRAGADVVEIDVCRTRDGVYYLFHDGNELGLLGQDKHFSEWTSEEIDSTSALNTTNSKSGYYIEKLEDYLEWLPEDKLINIDRAWPYYNDTKFFEILMESKKTDQIFLKSPVKEEYLELLNSVDFEISYIPIVKKKGDFEKVLEYKNIHTIGLEVIAPTRKHELFDPEKIKALNEEGYIVIGNAINLGPDHLLFSDYIDDAALIDGPDEIWGEMVKLGINMIRTDWPNFIANYRDRE